MSNSSTSSPPRPPPKVVYFDIGGVCVLSPFRAILDYETAHNIPHGWINYAISRSAPNGAWQRLERGEFKADARFFEMFREDLRHEDRWRAFHLKRRQTRDGEKEKEKKKKDGSGGGGKSEAARIGDAMGMQSASLSSQGAPGAIQERSGLHEAEGTATSSQVGTEGDETTPALPEFDVEPLFWSMMTIGQTTDPHIYPAVLTLRKSSNPKFIIGALSNTSLFPTAHPLNTPPKDPDFNIRNSFNLFISSAHSGMRKPEKRIYEYAMEQARKAWRESGREDKEGELRAEDVLFLDDIGENLRMARSLGWRTIRVRLGETKEAVRELERETGVSLLIEQGKL